MSGDHDGLPSAPGAGPETGTAPEAVSAPGAVTDLESARAATAQGSGGGAGRRAIVVTPTWLLEHAQDLVTVLVGIVLILLAGTLLVSGLVDFARHASGSVTGAAKNLIDVVLLVLILVEVVHTVVLSLRAHRLVAQPFLVVGLVAVVRRVLFVLSTPKPAGAAELGLLIAMVVAFVISLIAVTRFEERERANR